MMKRVRTVFCGEPLVGKSSIIHRFSRNDFSSLTTTVAGAFHSQCVQFGAERVALELWDTAGSERYHSVIPSFFRTASAVVVVYDVTVRETFERLRFWLEFARVHSPEDCQVFLVGNKIDLFHERAVEYEEGRIWSVDHEFAAYTETSAKSGEAIDMLFSLLARLPGCGTVARTPSTSVIELRSERCC
jgi:small GTP-binding protein